MRIHRRGGITREMLAAARYALGAQRVVERSSQPNDFGNITAIATAPQRIVSLVVERNVEHRTKIEIESKEAKQPAGDSPMPPNEIDVALFPQLLRVRRLLPDQTEPRHPPAFLVYRDDR